MKINIDKKEVLRYLGYKNQIINSNLNKKIDEAIIEIKQYFDLRYCYSLYNIEKYDDKIILKDTIVSLSGNNIKNLLKDSKSCILLCLTGGIYIDRKMDFYKNFDLTKSIILGACATEALEKTIDFLEMEIKDKYLTKEESLTFRYSPGYGDLSLDVQKDILNTLDCQRKIGVFVSKENILFPRKTITAVLGVTKNKICKKNKCLNCLNKNCDYRKV